MTEVRHIPENYVFAIIVDTAQPNRSREARQCAAGDQV